MSTQPNVSKHSKKIHVFIIPSCHFPLANEKIEDIHGYPQSGTQMVGHLPNSCSGETLSQTFTIAAVASQKIMQTFCQSAVLSLVLLSTPSLCLSLTYNP